MSRIGSQPFDYVSSFAAITSGLQRAASTGVRPALRRFLTLLIGEYKFLRYAMGGKAAGDPQRAQLLLQYYSVLRARFGPQRWWPARTRLEVILGAILTQNATWHNATLALRNLRKAGLLSWQGLRRASLSGLEACVRPSGFYRQKARTIRDFVDWLSRRARWLVG